MLAIQYDFFQTREESEMTELRKMIVDVKSTCDRVRKGTYAKIGDLTKRMNDLEERLMVIERSICRGK